ncbi:MAG: VWA domain-containing protein [bacterium]|nr:VWA domain-containing protein [bacterium]
MFTLGGVTYGLLNPFYFILAPLALGGLLYAYRRGGRGRELVVSTVMILKRLRRETRARKKIMPPLRFFLELLLLLLLITAASGLYKKGFKENYAVVIDNSFSMNAHSPSEINRSLMDIAKRDAQTFIGSLPFGSGVEVFVTTPTLHSASDGVIGRDKAVSLSNNIEAEFGPDNIDSALNRVSFNDSYQRIAIFSDMAPQNPSSDSRFLFRGSSDLVVRTQNIALLDAKVVSVDSESKIAKVTAKLAAFTKDSFTTKIRLELFESSDGSKEATLIKEEELVIPAGAVRDLSYRVPQSFAYQISISTSDKKFDSITQDNQAFLTNSTQRNRVVLVGAISPKILGLDKIKNFEFSWIKPEEYLGKTNSEEIYIFHNFVPSELPSQSSLFVNPLENGDFFEVGQEYITKNEDPLEITSWQEADALTSYLNLPTLKLKTLRPLKAKKGSIQVIGSNKGTVLLSLSNQESSFVVTGFELFPFRGKEAPLLSILTLNTLKWLSGSELKSGYERIPFKVDAAKIKSIIRGGNFGGETINSISSPGLYLLSESKDSLIATNYFSESESDTISDKKFIVPSNKESSSFNESAFGNYVFEIVLIALFLILVEMLFSFRNLIGKARRTV